GEGRLDRRHEARVERRAQVEWYEPQHGAASALGEAALSGADVVHEAGEHHLLRGVVVRDRHGEPLERSRDHLAIQALPDDRDHPSETNGNRVLHETAALTDDADRFAERYHARGHQRRVLTDAVAS